MSATLVLRRIISFRSLSLKNTPSNARSIGCCATLKAWTSPTMLAKVEKITEPVDLAEGPHWDARQQALFFVNIRGRTIHKYELGSRKHTSTKLDGRPGFIVPVEGTTDQFLIGVERKFLIVKWDGEEGTIATTVQEIAEVDPEVPTNRINDGKADPRGRVFAGTIMAGEPGKENVQGVSNLFRLDGAKMTKVVEGIRVSNGLAWNLEEKAMYYIDSVERNIRRYDYDVETGEISNMTLIFDLEKNKVDGYPDGCTIDKEGNLWVAVFNGSCVINIDPRTEKLLRRVPIPASQVTSVTFGGPNCDALFVTTANLSMPDPQEPPSGATFMVTGLNVGGFVGVNFKL